MSDVNTSFTEERYSQHAMEASDYSMERVMQTVAWLPTQGSLLEIGVWDGSIIRHYRPHFQGYLAGTDLNLEIMSNALPLLNEAKPCDLNRDALPWADATFDVVVCNEIIEHIFDTDRLLEEMHRVLKPGGKLIISTPNLASLPNRLGLLLGWQPFGTEVSARKSNLGNPLRKSLNPAGHIRVFTQRALLEILQLHGFKIRVVTATPISRGKWFKRIERLAAWISPALGSDSLVLCHKHEQA